jgi:hypothetical protein
MASICDGLGNCFHQININSYQKNPNITCENKCVLKKCKKCNMSLPEWVLECNNHMCRNCAVEDYNISNVINNMSKDKFTSMMNNIQPLMNDFKSDPEFQQKMKKIASEAYLQATKEVLQELFRKELMNKHNL